MKAVHFGAGNIGRGFIGHMLSASDYEVCFVARNPKKISLLQKRQEYPITLANATQDTTIVHNVTAINVNEPERVAQEIASADLITTAVGVSTLQDIARPIAQGIHLRMKNNNLTPLHIIACENAIGGSTRLKNGYIHSWMNRPATRQNVMSRSPMQQLTGLFRYNSIRTRCK